jgi:hypothetical protein
VSRRGATGMGSATSSRGPSIRGATGMGDRLGYAPSIRGTTLGTS